MVYLVMFRSHKLHAEDQTAMCGIFSSTTTAVTYAESLLAHEDDESWVVEFQLDVGDYGKAIWFSREKFIA